MTIEIEHLSPTQRKVLRIIARAPNHCRQIAGHKAGPLLSAARALVRKGVLGSWRTGYFFIQSDYIAKADAELTRWRAERDAAAAAGPEASPEASHV